MIRSMAQDRWKNAWPLPRLRARLWRTYDMYFTGHYTKDAFGAAGARRVGARLTRPGPDSPSHSTHSKSPALRSIAPELYVKHVKGFIRRCRETMESTPFKYNQSQCGYLLNKLEETIEDLDLFFKVHKRGYAHLDFPPKDETAFLCIVIGFFTLVEEVRGFIERCCNTSWIIYAIMLTNASEYVSTLGFDLELYGIIFKGEVPRGSLTANEVASLHSTELRKTNAIGISDKAFLMTALVSPQFLSGHGKAKHDLNEFLLVRLKNQSQNPKPDLYGSSDIKLPLLDLPSSSHFRSPLFEISRSTSDIERPPPGLYSKSSFVELSSLDLHGSMHFESIVMKGVKKLGTLGNGGFGSVHKAKWLGIEVAMKTFYGPDDMDFKNEVLSLTSLSHPNILSIFGCTTSEGKCAIVMEKMDMDLQTCMVKTKLKIIQNPLRQFILKAINMMQQIAQGMNYLHEMGIVHKDLRSHHILVRFVDNVEYPYLDVKVADFGLSITKEKSVRSFHDVSNFGTNEMRWRARELMLEVESDTKLGGKSKYGFKTDVYSFGMICYEILTGYDSHAMTMSQEPLGKNVLDVALLKLSEKYPKELQDMIEACWSIDPWKRPSFGDICVQLRHLKYKLMMRYAWPEEMSFELWSRDLPSKRMIGKGQAGIVYETTWKGNRFARKDFFGVPNKRFVKEAKVLVSLQDHENVVKTYGWTVDKGSCSIVLEYMDDDLLSLVQKKKESKWKLHNNFGAPSKSLHIQPFELLEALYMMLQIARGVKHLHEQGIAHGDLKTRNVLVTYTNNGIYELEHVKVVDFGLVDTKMLSRAFVSHQARNLNMVQWKAPECLETFYNQFLVDEDEPLSKSNNLDLRTRYDSSSNIMICADIYSFSMLCYQILTGDDPFPNMKWQELMDEILLSNARPKLPDHCPPSLSYLLESCWQALPSKRLVNFSKICEELEKILQIQCNIERGTRY